MNLADLKSELAAKFEAVYSCRPHIMAVAPGRVEILGNHTDYNDGLVLSAAIDRQTLFALAPRHDRVCRLTAGDLMQTVSFPLQNLEPRTTETWANYVIGVLCGLQQRQPLQRGFDALFLSSIPLGSGLSSSAALEISAGLAFLQYYGLSIPPLELARIAQWAEHRFAGVHCGLLDQVSSLFGRADCLVLTDFRDLSLVTRPVGGDIALLMCDSGQRHALTDGDYNQRRADCEAAVAHFQKILPHPVHALRDVRWQEWETHQAALPARVARRAAHPIGEIERVEEGIRCLDRGDLARFGALMFASHESSRHYFENSCAALDVLVDTARSLPGVLGARLSGGGFGGSAVMLLHPRDTEHAGAAIRGAFHARFGRDCEIRVLTLADGAKLL